MSVQDKVSIRKLQTGVPGLDEILGGGLPEFSFNIIAGAPGSHQGSAALTRADPASIAPGTLCRCTGLPDEDRFRRIYAAPVGRPLDHHVRLALVVIARTCRACSRPDVPFP